MLLVTHIFLFVFGLALFMFGMKCMTRALEKHTGDRLRNSLARLTSSSFKGLCLGAGVTAVIQSSSAVTVMLVGLVNAGILTLRETVGVIMGANIGTTATSWILSLVGMKGRGLLSILVNSYTIAAASALCGLLLYFFPKRKKKGLAACCFGFALLMCGMELMGYSLSPLRDVPQTAQVLTLFSNPFTALISCIGTNKNAKRTAFIHLYFNIIGALFWLAAFYGCDIFMRFSFMDQSASPEMIALIHTVFNILCTALLFPFSGLLVRLAKGTVR